MGRYYKSGLGKGIGTETQSSLEQEVYQELVERLSRDLMLKPLYEMGVKFTPENVIFVAKDSTGKIVWLEKGYHGKGADHIIEKHSKHFESALGIKNESIINFLKQTISKGKLIKSELININGRNGYNNYYDIANNKYYLKVGIGANGFIVSAFPVKKEK